MKRPGTIRHPPRKVPTVEELLAKHPPPSQAVLVQCDRHNIRVYLWNLRTLVEEASEVLGVALETGSGFDTRAFTDRLRTAHAELEIAVAQAAEAAGLVAVER